MKDRVCVPHECDCGGDMDHRVRSYISVVYAWKCSLVEECQNPWMSHDYLLKAQFNVYAQPLFNLDDLTGMYL